MGEKTKGGLMMDRHDMIHEALASIMVSHPSCVVGAFVTLLTMRHKEAVDDLIASLVKVETDVPRKAITAFCLAWLEWAENKEWNTNETVMDICAYVRKKGVERFGPSKHRPA